MSLESVLERYRAAASALAINVDWQHRRADLGFTADRSPEAERLRAARFDAELAEFRAASAELESFSEGDA